LIPMGERLAPIITDSVMYNSLLARLIEKIYKEAYQLMVI